MQMFEEIRRAIDGKVYVTLDDKIAAVEAEVAELEADPDEPARSPAGRVEGLGQPAAARIMRGWPERSVGNQPERLLIFPKRSMPSSA